VTSCPKRRCVEGEAEQAEGAADRDEDAADRRVPVALDPDRRGARTLSLLREAHRERAGAEDPEQADKDQVVSGIGERPRVAAVVDVERDVPVHPGDRDEERCGGDE
jgi:hypothetical protein